MLKQRIAGVVVVREGIAVQSLGFRRYLPVGRPEVVVDFLNRWGVDEIAVVDISAGRASRPNFELIQRVSSYCQVPLTYGGGLRSAEEMVQAVKAGADKVMINAGFRGPEGGRLIASGAAQLGNQCMIVGLDAKGAGSAARVYDYSSGQMLPGSVREWAERAVAAGAGELFLNSVDRDGAKQGLDCALAGEVARGLGVPLTICGGIGHADHFAAGLTIAGVSAVAAANYFNFTEHSVTTTKSYLVNKLRRELRLDTYFAYAQTEFLPSGRVAKKADGVLKELLFERHPPEVI